MWFRQGGGPRSIFKEEVHSQSPQFGAATGFLHRLAMNPMRHGLAPRGPRRGGRFTALRAGMVRQAAALAIPELRDVRVPMGLGLRGAARLSF
jgi:hypothetical protein